MNVYFNESIKEISGYDYSKRIEVNLRKAFEGEFNGSVNVENKFEWINIRKFGDSISFSNASGNLNANKWGDNYSISGNIKGEDGKYKYISLTVYKRFSDEFSFAINSYGINIYFDKYSVNGNFDETLYSKKTIAYITSMIFAIEIDSIKSNKANIQIKENYLLN
ncbi:MAG: hypothetical protein K6357_06465 [Elusimicrobiota bacterium]